MEERFGCRVYTTYQTVETGKIGFQCERREGLHLNVDLCPVRLVDEGGRTVQAGEPGARSSSPISATGPWCC